MANLKLMMEALCQWQACTGINFLSIGYSDWSRKPEKRLICQRSKLPTTCRIYMQRRHAYADDTRSSACSCFQAWEQLLRLMMACARAGADADVFKAHELPHHLPRMGSGGAISCKHMQQQPMSRSHQVVLGTVRKCDACMHDRRRGSGTSSLSTTHHRVKLGGLGPELLARYTGGHGAGLCTIE